MKKFFNAKIDKAIIYASWAHRKQLRKTELDVPYICHPVSVGFILQTAGFDEDTIIAGILHDTIEDTEVVAEDIEKSFGKRVKDLVLSVSEDKSLEWEERKNKYLEKVLAGSDSTKAISVADKIQNVQTLINNVDSGRTDFWQFFTMGKEITIDHYLKSAQKIKENWSHPLVDELLLLVQKLKKIA